MGHDKSIHIGNSGREEIAEFLKLKRNIKKKFFFYLNKAIKKYGARDGSKDIEQNIFEGLIQYLNTEKVELKNYDLITKQLLRNKGRVEICSKKLIKLIINDYNRIKINTHSLEIQFIIEDITSTKYGKRQGKKADILKMSINNQEFFTEESLAEHGICDTDTEVDIEMKYFIDKYYQSLTIEEQEIFTKYFYEETSYANMLEMGYVKNEYTLKSFIKKTKKYFHNQLIEDN